MKKTNLVILLAVFTLFFVSCENSSKKQYEVIPDDAAVLVKANFGNVINESEILEVPMVRTALDFMVNSMPKESRDMFREIITDPSKSGVNVNEPMVISVSTEPVEVVVSMAMSDKNRFVEVFEALAEGTGVELVEEGGMTKVDLGNAGNNELDVAFDSEVMVIVVSETGNADAGDYMALDGGRQAINNSKYEDFFAANSDASFFVDAASLIEKLSNLSYYTSEEQSVIYDLYVEAGLSLLANLNFENGFAEIDTRMYASDEYMNKMEQYWMTPKGKFLEYVPFDAVGVCNVALDFGKAFEHESEYMEEMLPMIEELGFNEEMIKSLAGEFMFAVLQPEKLGLQELPQMMFAVECKGRETFDAVLALMGDVELMSVSDDVYALGLNKYYDRSSGEFVAGGYDYYLMYKDDAIFVLPENIYNDVVDGDEMVALGNNVTGNDCFAALEKSGMVGDISAIVAMCQESGLGNMAEFKMALGILGLFENFEVVMKNPAESSLKVNMVDKDKNVLKQILDEAMAIASSSALGAF